MKRLLPLMLIAAFGMVACGKDESAAPEAAKIAAASTSPEAAMQAQVEALRAGQFSSAFLASIPPSMIDQVRAKWTAKMAEPASEEDRAQFQEMITELTADGAEDAIYAKIEPDLLKFKESAAMQMPMYVGMGRGILAAGVQQREDLSADQKAQAMASIDAFAKWAESAQFAEPALAKQAIGHVCKAARDIKLTNIDELRALSFDEAVKRGDVLFVALKDILGTYGFKIDDVLATAKTEVVSQTGDSAKVKISYTMFEAPLSFESEMVKLDGRWYGKDSLESLKKDLAEPAVEAEPAVAGDAEAPAQG
ncbi:MAG: hypothetical protein IPO95_13930 [Rhodanobacteraceae bacterium]|jgi:hypothetical protein|nr:hypothetical protein [Rhodanobacteraceae bacterium]MBL0039719.1 hypothetical protein [Xanthomonadales bacterium]MBP6078529.1 hypothetical protein [Xanthomonadales bacterium]MBP7623511.1 hypothetical protein [Xanthomonadales bacterium]